MTTLVGDRRTTSVNPARSYRLREPKNMKSSWLRPALSTGYASSTLTLLSRAKPIAAASSLRCIPIPR